MKLFPSLLLCVAVSAWASDENKPAPPPLPTEVKLASGSVLRNVTVLSWRKDAVVLKHAGGADPVRYNHIAEPHRGLFEARRDAELAAQQKTNGSTAQRAEAEQKSYNSKIASAEEARRTRAQHDEIASKGNIVKGMSTDMVVKAWGEPARKNGTGTGLIQWVYYGTLRSAVRAYVYFRDGEVYSYEIDPNWRR